MKKPVHNFPQPFPVEGAELVIGGIPITRLAARAGQTPFYAYDRGLLNARVAHLRKHLPAELRLHYAIKANPMPAVVQHMASLVDGFDLASMGEMHVALDTHMPAHKISIAGPGKSLQELSCAIAAGVTINMESEHEMETIARLAQTLGVRPTVAIRVNPDFELKSSGMKMGGGPKQFGVDAERVPAMLRRLQQLDLNFSGFHIYSGSQNLKPEAIIEAQEKTFELAYRLSDHAPGPVRKLNIGGGFGIPYFPGDTPLDIAPIGEHLARRLPEVKQRLPEAEVVTELGRYLVGEAGVYVCRVIERKISREHVFLVTDGGLHHHLAASGNFGQFVRKNYPVLVGNKMNSTTTEPASVVGPLCTPLDLLGDKMDLPQADSGDLIVILQSGAYGLTASPTRFLSHPEPMEVLV